MQPKVNILERNVSVRNTKLESGRLAMPATVHKMLFLGFRGLFQDSGAAYVEEPWRCHYYGQFDDGGCIYSRILEQLQHVMRLTSHSQCYSEYSVFKLNLNM